MPRIHDEETPLLRHASDDDEHDACYESHLTASSSTTTLAAPAVAASGSDSSIIKPVKASAAATREETPLPWAQFSLVLFLQLAEPLTSQVIYPFVPELIRSLGITNGDETRVGYYVGLMQSIFFATQALTVLHWSRLSDTLGRKPVLLTGLSGLALSMYAFGLSRSFPALVFSRALNGFLNGNIGVIKSIMGEMTDDTNVARAFAYQPIAWSTGATLGPLIGGSLSRPAEKFPDTFGHSEFFRTYPYFLPCAIPATFTIICWSVVYLFLEETNPTGYTLSSLFFKSKSKSLSPTLMEKKTQPALLSLLTPRVTLAASNYALLSLLDIAYRALQPVFLSTPLSLAGPGLSPRSIGWALAGLGVMNGAFQVLGFAKAVKRWGVRNCYLAGIACAGAIFMTFPAMSVVVRWGIITPSTTDTAPEEESMTETARNIVYAILFLQLVLTVGLNICYGCVFIYINGAAASRKTLGATNGLAQMMVSVMRAIGPASASGLFSLSLKIGQLEGGEMTLKGLVGSWLVYGVMLVLVGVAYGVGRMLPEEVWKREEESE
ncbi:MFS general substrate transporter [Schizopora paradoxa]|uniref:MFS general substrate transporter n=1 Tax=Schizopora paradoxa TaxID=27342 RepID=A0A0H2RB34_9AGAM|nr:MFS general substrate transporter [Schizopora paradoxa]